MMGTKLLAGLGICAGLLFAFAAFPDRHVPANADDGDVLTLQEINEIQRDAPLVVPPHIVSRL